MRIQSNPASARISAAIGLDRLCQIPICNRPDFSACLKELWRRSIAFGLDLMDFRVRRRGAPLEKVEVAPLVRLAHMFREQTAVAARVSRRGLPPGRAALFELLVAHLEAKA